MAQCKLGVASSSVIASLLLGLGCTAAAQELRPVVAHECDADLALTGVMSDIISNAMVQGLKRPETEVAAYLKEAKTRYATGPELLTAAAAHFKVDEAVLGAEVAKYHHINCMDSGDGEAGAALPDDGLPVPAFAKDVTLHVVLHEIGHGLIREFDIPILGNEETMADAFATYYLTTYLPDRAVDVLTARVTSLMIEAKEAPGDDWAGEHDHDGRRAYQIAALAVAADREKYAPVAAVVGMSAEDISDARDYGAEIRRSWRRVLGPLWMPEGTVSNEARVVFENKGFVGRLCSDGLAHEVETAIRRFDWHSQVTVRFVDGDGGAAWSRESRTVTVNSGYVRRFIEQGAKGLAGPN
jgi:hypothetical protein